MKEIPLSQGKVAIVDDADYEVLAAFKWSVQKNRQTFYAYRKEPNKPNGKTVFMHRAILNAPQGVLVDHGDGNGLNNQRVNLTLVTHRGNTSNREKHRRNPYSLGSFRHWSGRYNAQIMIDGKVKYLGLYDTQKEAHEAYLQAVAKEDGKARRIL